MNKRLVFLILVLILLAGFYLRIGGVLSSSFAFTYDVGRDMLELAKISKFDIPLIGPTTGLAGLYYGPWWYYILTPAFLLSKGNPQGVAFFMVLTGLVTIVFGYLLGKLGSGKNLGLVIASFISLSTVMIGISNQIWNPNVIPLLVTLVLLLLVILERKKSLWINLSIGFFLGLIFDLEIVFGALFLTGFIVSRIYIYRMYKMNMLNSGFAFISLGFFVTLLPRIIFETRHQFVMSQSFFVEKGESQRIFDAASFFSVFPERIATILSQLGDTFGVNFTFSIVIILGTTVTRLLFRRKIKQKELLIIDTSLIILAVFLIGSSFFARDIWLHYLVGLPVLYIVIVSLSIILISRKSLLFSILVFVTLLVTSLKPIGLWTNLSNANWEGDAAVYRNQVAVVDYTYKEAKGRKFNYITYTPVVHDYTYQYLFDWYGREKYKAVPSIDTQSLLFVIIERDPGFESRQLSWLKLRDGDGKVLKEKVVKGGIRVQTRVR